MPLIRSVIISTLMVLFSLTPALAQVGNGQGAERRAEAERGIHRCTVAEIAIFPNRMHIVCAHRQGVYYSLAMNDTPYVDHVLNLAHAAFEQDGTELVIQVDTERRDNNPGCQANDCYRIQWVMLREARGYAE